MRRTALFLVVISMLATFLGAPVQAAEKAKKPYEIGVIILSREHVFFNLIEDAMEQKARDMGINLICVDGQLDSNIQYNQVQDFITQQVDAIVIAPFSNAGSAPAIKLADDAGIPIFTMDASSDGQPKSHVGTNNLEGGRIAGQCAIKTLNGKGTAAVITMESSPTCKDRENGFVEVVSKEPGIEIVAISDYMGDANKAAAVTQDFLTNHPDLDIIFATGDPAAIGAMSSIKASGKNTRVIGYDGNPEAIAAIKDSVDGKLWIADVAQDPAGIGRKSIEVVVEYLENGKVDPLFYIDPYLIDLDYIKENNL